MIYFKGSFRLSFVIYYSRKYEIFSISKIDTRRKLFFFFLNIIRVSSKFSFPSNRNSTARYSSFVQFFVSLSRNHSFANFVISLAGLQQRRTRRIKIWSILGSNDGKGEKRDEEQGFRNGHFLRDNDPRRSPSSPLSSPSISFFPAPTSAPDSSKSRKTSSSCFTSQTSNRIPGEVRCFFLFFFFFFFANVATSQVEQFTPWQGNAVLSILPLVFSPII